MVANQGESLTRQALFYSLAALIAGFAWFLVGLPAWQTYHTDIAFQTFIAFLAIACIAISLLAYRERPKPFLILIQSALFYASAMHTGFAVDNLYTLSSPILVRSTLNLFNDLVELALLSCLLFLSLYGTERCQRYSRRGLYSITFILGIIMLFIYTALSGRIISIIPEVMMQGFGVLVFGVIIILLIASIFFVFKSSTMKSPFQPIALIVFFVLLASASVPLIVPLFYPSVIWTFSVTLQSLAFFILYLSLSIPYLQDVGVKSRHAAVFASGFSILFLAPFIVTLVVEGLIPGFYHPDMSAYNVIHLGAASLSAVMALLTYGHAKTKGKENLYPLILLFASWTVVDITQVIMSRLPLPYVTESLVPYITGSIVSLFALSLAIRWTMGEPPANLPRAELWPILGFVIQTGLVTLSEIIQFIIIGAVPSLLESPLGMSVLLTINLFAMFEFTYFIVYLSRKSGGHFTIDVLLTGFLSLWIVPNILKANFLEWTAGWYSAELLLLAALLLGPGVIGMLYIGEMRRAEIAHQRARVYSDLLVHDISNYHQAILISLGLLEVNGIQPGLSEQMIRDAQTELRRADELIRNVRQIGMSEEIDLSNLERLDLIECIRNSYENAVPPIHRQSVEFSVNRNLGECYVHANRLIEGIFSNLLRNSIQYSPDKKRVEVEVELGEDENRSVWVTKIIDFGQGIEPEKKAILFNRFMIGAKGTGLGLSVAKTLTEVFGGKIAVRDRVSGDYTQGSVFIVILPVAPTIEL
jgi:signal transduction histidine kinase